MPRRRRAKAHSNMLQHVVGALQQLLDVVEDVETAVAEVVLLRDLRAGAEEKGMSTSVVRDVRLSGAP